MKRETHSVPGAINSNKEEGELSDDYNEGEDEDHVTLEKLQQLSQSEELKTLLENPHLRQMVQHLYSSENQAKSIDSAMHEPIFVEFADKCREIVEPEKYAET